MKILHKNIKMLVNFNLVKFKYIYLSGLVWLLNSEVVLATTTPQQEAMAFVDNLNDVILFPLIALLSGIALLFFVYGAAEYILNAESDTAREQGKKHITYGLIGLVVMLSAYAILTIATGTFGLSQQQKCAVDSTLPGCDTAFKIK
jgi:Type IV secretion system pilin